jgi:hypothetical protein
MFVADTPPNVTVVPVDPGEKFVPLMITGVPPPTGPVDVPSAAFVTDVMVAFEQPMPVEAKIELLEGVVSCSLEMTPATTLKLPGANGVTWIVIGEPVHGQTTVVAGSFGFGVWPRDEFSVQDGLE